MQTERESIEPILNLESYLNRAEQEYLFLGKTEFTFPIRRKSQDLNFYIRLESELRAQDLLRIQDFRVVKEGYARLSRPSALGFNLDALLKKRSHLRLLKTDLEGWHQRYSKVPLFEFARSYPRDTFANLGLTHACAEVLNYLILNREACVGLLPREIAHGQSTKLIGKEPLLLKMFSHWLENSARWNDFYDHFGLLDRPAEFRIYAPECTLQGQRLKGFHGLLSRDFSKGFDFKQLAGTLIIENYESFYVALRHSQASLIVWGSGWKAASLRACFQLLPEPIYYWGDIDKEGYEIFGYLKRQLPILQPVLMDRATIEANKTIYQVREKFFGPYKNVPDLQSEYEWISTQGLQIEQEQLQARWPYGTSLR